MTTLINDDRNSIKRASILAEKLRAGAAARISTRLRRIGPGKIAAPIEYQLSAIQQPANHRASALLLPIARTRVLTNLIEQLNEAQAQAIRFVRDDQWLLAYLTVAEIPIITGAIRLRAIEAKDRVLLLPIDLAFTPKINDRELAALLLKDHQSGILTLAAGRLELLQFELSKALTLAEIIAAPFSIVARAPLTSVEERAASYGARLRSIVSPPLPNLGEIVRLSDRSGDQDADEGMERSLVGPLSWWQRLKSFLRGQHKQATETALINKAQQENFKAAAGNQTGNAAGRSQAQPGITTRVRGWFRRLFSGGGTTFNRHTFDIRKDGGVYKQPLLIRLKDKLAADLSLGMLKRFPLLARMIFSRQSEHLIRMLEMFNQGNLEDAFRNAIPLGEEEQGQQQGPQRIGFGTPKPRRDLEFRLLELFARRSGMRSAPIGPNGYQLLKQQYELGAQKLLEQQNYRAAAYVYAQLLKDFRRAAQALAKGGYHREAAVIYLEKLNDAFNAALELAAGGDYQRAAEVAMSAKEFKLAIKIYRMIGDEASARDCLEKMIEHLLSVGNIEEAIYLIETELQDLRRAAKMLIEIYPTKMSESRILLGVRAARFYLRSGAREEIFTIVRRMRRDLSDAQIMGVAGSGTACSAMLAFGKGLMQLEQFAIELAKETGETFQPLNLEREGWRVATAAAAGFARAGYQAQTNQALEVLKLQAGRMGDPLLITDLERAGAQLQIYRAPAVEKRTEAITMEMPKAGAVVATTLHGSAVDIILIGRGDGSVESFFDEANSTINRANRARVIGPYRYSATALATNLDCTRIAALSIDGVVTIWSEQGDLLMEFRNPAAPYTALCPTIFNSQLINSHIIVGNAKGHISAIDIKTGRASQIGEQPGVITAIAYDLEHELFAFGGRDENILINSAKHGAEQFSHPLRNINTGFAGVRSMTFKRGSTGRPTIAFGGDRGDLVVAEMQSATGLGTIVRHQLVGHSHWINALCYSADGWLASAGYDRKIYLWQDPAAPPVTLAGHNNEIVGLAFTRFGTLYSADTRGVLACWDIKARRLMRVFELEIK